MLVMVVFFIAFRWIHLSPPLIGLFLLVLILLLMPTLTFLLHLPNTTEIKQYDGLNYGGDEPDARHLAYILRLGLLPEGHIMPKADRTVRDLARRRMQLVGQRTTQIVSIQTSMAQHIGAAMSGNDIKLLSALDIDAMPIGTTDALGMKANLAILQALQVQINGLEAALHQHCQIGRA